MWTVTCDICVMTSLFKSSSVNLYPLDISAATKNLYRNELSNEPSVRRMYPTAELLVNGNVS